MAMKATQVMPRNLTRLVHEAAVALVGMMMEEGKGFIGRELRAFIDILEGGCDSQQLGLLFKC